MKRRSPSGFALVSTLAILVVVTILLVAFATVMRTERAASQNFVERSRAEAIGLGMLNRILAEHAAPVGDRETGAPVQPFSVGPTTGLPTKQASEDYFAATGWNATTGPDVPIDFDRELLQPIYQMVPDNISEFERIGLVRTSKPVGGGGKDAYSREFWAYGGLTRGVLGTNHAEPQTVPQWVDYYQPDDPSTPEDESREPVAQVAFAIWDEGGKFDVNVIGRDDSVNGIAPHDLKIEEALTGDNGARLFAYLNNQDGNGERDRSNFSLRRVVSQFHPPPGSGLANDKGDDRWVFSMRELIQRDLIDPSQFRMVTTNSRDFDVRPEWNADRAPSAPGSTALGAQDFLRSYINNPALYRLFYGAGAVGPSLVWNNLNEEELSTRLQADGTGLTPPPSGQYKADWMQVMRLLAVLRRGMPPYGSAPSAPSSTDLALNEWKSPDIWAVGLNLIQASAPPSDHNLFAYNPDAHPKPHDDPNVRIGNRLSPLITEVAVKMTKVQGQNSYRLTLYFKLWNPYPFELKHNGEPIRYRLGNYTFNQWPFGTSSDPGIWNLSDRRSRAENITAPPPGEFKVVRFRPSEPIPATTINDNRYNGSIKLFRIRPFLQIMDYTREFKSGDAFADRQSAYLNLQMGTFYALGGMNRYDQLLANVSLFPTEGEPKWYSFQIDDPRMGSVKRNAGISSPPSNVGPSDAPYPPANDNFKWSWLRYHKQAMRGCLIWEDDLANPAEERLVNDGNVMGGIDPDMAPDFGYNGKTFNGTSGYNRNFGINWPGADPVNGVTSDEDFARMMATFALPGRPFLNIGELGTVFAYRPWVTLNFANKIIPDENILGGAVTPKISAPPANNAALLRPAAILDYFTTIGTPASMDFDNPSDNLLRYMDPAQFAVVSGRAPDADKAQFQQEKRYQDKTWLFESLAGGSTVDSQVPDGNLRPIRGRINLNTASTEVLATLLKAPYRMPASIGLKLMGAQQIDPSNPRSDYLFTVQEADARAMAAAITLPVNHGQAIRPLRMLSDLSQLYDRNPALMKSLYDKYPQSVISAMIGRLAQFGTVRQQAYTIDMVVRTVKGENRVVTGEARLQARVFFDSFSRQAFIESVEYR